MKQSISITYGCWFKCHVLSPEISLKLMHLLFVKAAKVASPLLDAFLGRSVPH